MVNTFWQVSRSKAFAQFHGLTLYHSYEEGHTNDYRVEEKRFHSAYGTTDALLFRGLDMSNDIPTDALGDRYQLALPPSEQDHRLGSLDARVVLVEYGDYQCPGCGELYTLIKTIQAQLNATLFEENYLCFVFRHFPQSQIYPQAQKAAAAAEAAGAQGQFWQMYEILLEHQQELGDGYLVEYANNLGLDIAQFLRDIARGVYVDRINEDIASGKRSGVTSTPALFINGVRYTNVIEIEPLFTAILESGNLS